MAGFLRRIAERLRLRPAPPDEPRLSVVCIVLNGMPFIELALRGVYDFAHEIIVVEGAVEKCRFAANPDGSSRDDTVACIQRLPDPRGIIRLIRGSEEVEGGVWEEKLPMQNRALEEVTGNYVFLVDSDEIWSRGDLTRIRELLQADPTIDQMSFVCHNFWKGFDYVFESPKFFEPWAHYRRIFRYVPGARFSSHRPPTLLHPSGKTTEEMHHVDGNRTVELGIRPYHYSYVLEDQVNQKIELYRRYGWGEMWDLDLEGWYRDCFLAWTPDNREAIEAEHGPWTGDPQSYTKPFPGEHPEAARSFIAAYRRHGGVPPRARIAGQDAAEDVDLTKISEQSSFADAIRQWIRAHRPRRIIETGTYLGSGTTKVIAETLRDEGLDDTRFCSIEVNPEHLRQARENLAAAGLAERVQILQGLSVPRGRLPTEEEIHRATVEDVAFEDVFVDHPEEERTRLYHGETDFPEAEDDLLGAVLAEMEGRPDFVLLDSGGHMGRAEFAYLLEHLRGPCTIALDDVYHVKHQANFQRMQQDERFEILTSGKEKFGYCIARYDPAVPCANEPNGGPAHDRAGC